MKLSLSVDEFGRLVCAVDDGSSPVIVTSSTPDAAGDLADAARDALESGAGECFWTEGCGEYRWMLRRNGDSLRVVVLWSTGTMTGWEHVLWAECPAGDFLAQVEAEAAKLPARTAR